MNLLKRFGDVSIAKPFSIVPDEGPTAAGSVTMSVILMGKAIIKISVSEPTEALRLLFGKHLDADGAACGEVPHGQG